MERKDDICRGNTVHNLIADPFDLPLCGTPVLVKTEDGLCAVMARKTNRWYFPHDPYGITYRLNQINEWAECPL